MIKIKEYTNLNNFDCILFDEIVLNNDYDIILLNAKLLPQNKIVDIVIKNKNIFAIENIDEKTILDNPKVINCDGYILTAGLIDRHIHGGFDCCFNQKKDYTLLFNGLLSHGITSILPCIMTDDIKNINNSIEYIKGLGKNTYPKILGIHLEGPFINKNFKGIHPEQNILKPNINNLNKINNLSFIKLLTYAYELDEDNKFTENLKSLGIIPSIGHSACDYDDAQRAFSNEVKQITHLYNALKKPHHREPGLVNAALINDNIYVEIICDYLHLHKGTVDLVLKIKPKEKILLISDALPCAYSKEKETVFGGEKIFINNNIASSQDGTIAGSTFFIDEMLRNIGFEEYIICATKNIAESLNIKDKGEIKEGNCADIVLWDKTYHTILTIIDGKIVYKKQEN